MADTKKKTGRPPGVFDVRHLRWALKKLEQKLGHANKVLDNILNQKKTKK
jgi:hypothetical protein